MFFRLVTLAALVLAPFQAQAPATPAEAPAKLPDAREIINRHIAAIGGKDAILSHKSMHAVGTLSVPASGLNGPIEIFGATNPTRLVVKSTVAGIGDIIEGYDGTHAWSVNPMTGPTLKVGKELDETKYDADFYSELRDPKTYPEVKTLEKTTFDNRPCYKVSVKRIDGAEDIDFYDVATGLRAGSIVTRESPMGKITMTAIQTDYKKVGKLSQPMLHTQQMMGVEQKITLSTVEYDTVDPSVFEPPASIKALIK